MPARVFPFALKELLRTGFRAPLTMLLCQFARSLANYAATAASCFVKPAERRAQLDQDILARRAKIVHDSDVRIHQTTDKDAEEKNCYTEENAVNEMWHPCSMHC